MKSEPTSTESTIALEFYKAARSEIAFCLTQGEEANRQFLTIASVLIGSSITGAALDIKRLSLVCCLTPCFSLIFSVRRWYLTGLLIRNASFIRYELNEYFALNFPNIRTDRLDVANWERFTKAIPDKELDRVGMWSSVLALHFPSLISLGIVFYIRTKSLQSEPALHNLSDLVILLSVLIWAIALGVTTARARYIKRAIARDSHLSTR